MSSWRPPNAEVARLAEAVKELAVKLTLLEEKGAPAGGDYEPVPTRVDAARPDC